MIAPSARGAVQQNGGAGSGRNARISDVAREAGVSTATVSRALSDPEKVRPELRAKVQAAVEKLGYTPNAAARSLRVRRSRTVLVLTLRRWSAPFFSEVLRGLDVEFAEKGYTMVLGNFDVGDQRRRHLVDMMFSGHIDGAVILSGIVAEAGGRSMFDAGLPLVSVAAATQGAHNVLTNERECMVEAVRRLRALGHRSFLYLPGPEKNYNERVRWEALSAFFAEPDQADLSLGRGGGTDFSMEAGVRAGQEFLALRRRPTAVLAASDEIAIGFMKIVRGAGIAVPADVSIIGFDGIEFADFCEPTLSTIRQPRYELGRLGARVLLEAIEAGKPQAVTHHLLPSTVDLRGSTGPAPREA